MDFSEKNVGFFTFNKCCLPNPDITPWILDFLKEKNIKATFFCVGSNILKYPELFERITTEGHQVGNHTMNHEKGIETPFKEYKDSIVEAETLVKNTLFRPPYGRINARQSFQLSKKYKIIMWSWLSYDFDPSVPIEKILRKAEKQIQAGDILVLHDNSKVKERVKILLPEIIEIIKRKELDFKVIE